MGFGDKVRAMVLIRLTSRDAESERVTAELFWVEREPQMKAKEKQVASMHRYLSILRCCKRWMMTDFELVNRGEMVGSAYAFLEGLLLSLSLSLSGGSSLSPDSG
jgi:hypothetical protein